MGNDISIDINHWAEKFVPKFNEITKRDFYTQSPLSSVSCSGIEQMIIGINPAGSVDDRESDVSPQDFLRGNINRKTGVSYWATRFNSDGSISKDWVKYLGGGRFFLGYGHQKTTDSIDNDGQTVWTNLSPFYSPRGDSDLPKGLMAIGIESTVELIKILKPKRIVLLGVKAFERLKSFVPDEVVYEKLFANQRVLVGRIANFPAISVPHPSGKWPVSNKFIALIVHLHKLSDIPEDGAQRSLNRVVEMMRDEILRIQSLVKVTE